VFDFLPVDWSEILMRTAIAGAVIALLGFIAGSLIVWLTPDEDEQSGTPFRCQFCGDHVSARLVHAPTSSGKGICPACVSKLR
jgi:hypothetical protein